MQPSSEANRELHCRPARERDDDWWEIRERPNVMYAIFYGYFRGDIDLEANTPRANDRDVSNSGVLRDNGQSAAASCHSDGIANRDPSPKEIDPDTSTSEL